MPAWTLASPRCDYLCAVISKNFNGKTVAFHTLGCKLNFAETSTIARSFDAEGYGRAELEAGADVVVINTCSVTENADKECRTIVKRALAANPDAFITIVGCYAQLKPEEIAQIPGVDLVLGATEKFKISHYLNDLTKRDLGEVHSCEISEANTFVGSYAVGDRTRAFLKVQDGCDYKCTYCTIPLARGISRSDTLHNVLRQAREIAERGIREIVLTGVNIGDYGKGEMGNKHHEHTFLDLIEALDQVEGIERLRISSIEPNLLQDAIIQFVAQSKHFVPHFHIPLQSGSNAILGKMKRRYRRELYADKVAAIREHMPNACIGVDVIVGFPGETEDHFLETYQFLNELDINYLHVFTYSERANTEAAEMENRVPVAERKRRNKMLRGLSVKKLRAFYDAQRGQVAEVLFEAEDKAGWMFGYSPNYLRVKVPFDPNKVNQRIPIRLHDLDPEGVFVGKEVAAIKTFTH
jgi:threonylcarbamoyladenosine tRNA methylthiotransferase MtaB